MLHLANIVNEVHIINVPHYIHMIENHCVLTHMAPHSVQLTCQTTHYSVYSMYTFLEVLIESLELLEAGEWMFIFVKR